MSDFSINRNNLISVFGYRVPFIYIKYKRSINLYFNLKPIKL